MNKYKSDFKQKKILLILGICLLTRYCFVPQTVWAEDVKPMVKPLVKSAADYCIPAVEIYILDNRQCPIVGVRVAAYLDEDSKATATVMTDETGRAVFRQILLYGSTYNFVVLFDNNPGGLNNIGELADYDDHEYGDKILNSYFLTIPVKISYEKQLIKKAFVVRTEYYVDFTDIGGYKTDFWLVQKANKVRIRFTAAQGTDVVRIYMPMNYMYTAQPAYSADFTAGQYFAAAPRLLITLK